MQDLRRNVRWRGDDHRACRQRFAVIGASHVNLKPWLPVRLAVTQCQQRWFRATTNRRDARRWLAAGLPFRRETSTARRAAYPSGVAISWPRAARFHTALQIRAAFGNAARRLKRSGSPAYTPETKGADQPLEQLVSEFAADKRGDGFILRGRLRAAQDFREQAPFRAGRNKRRGQQRRRRERRRDQAAAHENVARRARVGVQKLFFQPKRADQLQRAVPWRESSAGRARSGIRPSPVWRSCRRGARRLRAYALEFRLAEGDRRTRGRKFLRQSRVPGNGVGAGMDTKPRSVGSECFGKKLAAFELLLFEIRVEHHGDIANEDAPQQRRAHHAVFECRAVRRKQTGQGARFPERRSRQNRCRIPARFRCCAARRGTGCG